MFTKCFYQKLIDYSLLAILVIFPLSIHIALLELNDLFHPLFAINISVADLLIGAIMLLWIIKIVIYKEYHLIKIPPIPILVYIAVCLLSFVHANSISSWIKEIFQLIEYLILFYILLINNLHVINIKAIKNTLFISTTIILIVAFVQQIILNGDPYLIRGLFKNRNTLAAFLCITIPIVYTDLISASNILHRIWMTFLLALTYIVITSGISMIIIVMSLFVINFLYNKKVLLKYVITILVIGIAYPLIMPKKNINAIKESVSIYEQGKISKNYDQFVTITTGLRKKVIFQKTKGNNILRITNDVLMSSKLPPMLSENRFKELDGEKHIKNRYLEMQAAINMLKENIFLGVGLGNYQNHIGTFYNELPKVNTMEPNQNNGYLIIATTTGIFGIVALLFIYLSALRNAYLNYITGNSKDKFLYLALTGSLIACLIQNFFSDLFVASLFIPTTLILYFSFKNKIKGTSKIVTIKLSNYITHCLYVVLTICLVVFICAFSIKKTGSKEYLWIEAEDTDEIYNNLEIIEDNEASGNKAITSATKSHEVNSYAVYNVTANKTDEYQLWARLYGDNACGNSFLVSFDNSNRFVIGNDDLMRTWHWVKGPVFDFKNGKHKLLLWNEEYGASIDKILLTSDKYYIPSHTGENSDYEVNFEEIIPDFFVFKNKKTWKRKLFNTDHKLYLPSTNNIFDYFIIKKSVPNINYFKSDFTFNKTKPVNLVLLSNYTDDNNYNLLEINDDKIIYQKKMNNIIILNSSSKIPVKELLNEDATNQISMIKEGNFFIFKLNGITIKTIKEDQNCNQIGLGSRTGDIYFDNIYSKSDLSPSLECNFFSGISKDWIIADGRWNLLQEPFYRISGEKINENPAIFLNGDEFWKNYSFSATVKAEKQGIGIAFNVQNKNNYYLFKWENTHNNGDIKLIKVKNGKETILCTKKAKFNPEEYYKIQAVTSDGYIETFINEEQIFTLNDSSFLRGKIGIWTNSIDNNSYFDDIKVHPYSSYSDSVNIFSYEFNNRLDISEDLSDWEVSDVLSSDPDRIFTQKESFEEKVIYNKKIFTDNIKINLRPTFIPSDIDLVLYFRSISKKEYYKLTLENNKFRFKSDENNIASKDIHSRNGALEIIYQDKKQHLVVKLNEEIILNVPTKKKFNNYKLGIGYEGIGRWKIDFPTIILTTNEYHVDQF